MVLFNGRTKTLTQNTMGKPKAAENADCLRELTCKNGGKE